MVASGSSSGMSRRAKAASVNTGVGLSRVTSPAQKKQKLLSENHPAHHPESQQTPSGEIR
jgi:hypothetical protein